MIPINAYKCSHCRKKVLESYSGMWKHEKKCFYNPETKSCITCKYFTDDLFIGKKQLTAHEHMILQYKVEGTYTEKPVGDHFGITDYAPVLNEEYRYLYEAENKYYCSALNEVIKLKTNCNYHKTK